EGAHLQVKEEMEPEDAMIKDQINIIVLVVQGDAHLAGLEAKARAEFQQKCLQVVQQGGFQLTFIEVSSLGQAGEFKHIRIANKVAHWGGGFGALGACALNDFPFVSGQAGALVEQGTYLALELADGPVAF